MIIQHSIFSLLKFFIFAFCALFGVLLFRPIIKSDVKIKLG